MKIETRTIYLLLLYTYLLCIGCPSQLTASSSMETPVEVQVPILMNVLTFDRNFKQHSGDELLIGILYQEKFRESLDIKNNLEKYLKKNPPQFTETSLVRWIGIQSDSIRDLKITIEKEKPDVLYITPLRALPIKDIVSLTRSMKITSITGVPHYCELGVSVAVGSKGGNPLIIINLPSAIAEGADFSSKLLKLAKIINNTMNTE